VQRVTEFQGRIPLMAVLMRRPLGNASLATMDFDMAGLATPCISGLQLGSSYVADPEKDMVFDYLPESLMLERTHNLQDFGRMLVLDKWAGNADGRQGVFTKPATARKYSATFID
jgi:hypothetical protein